MSEECNLEECFYGSKWYVISMSVFTTLLLLMTVMTVCCLIKYRRLGCRYKDLCIEVISLNAQLYNAETDKEVALNRLSSESALMDKYHDVVFRSPYKRLNVRYSNEVISLTEQLDNAKREKEEALYRLSELASNRLRDGNPNIADIGDENRPGNLDPKFSEIYDNEWTNAVEELEAGRADKGNEELTKKIAGLLLDIVKFSFEVCREVTRRQLLLMQQMIIEPSLPEEEAWPNAQSNMRCLSKEFMKRVKDQRGSVMPDLTRVTNMVQSRINGMYSEGEFGKCLSGGHMQTFMRSCIHVIWLMNVQDPPMFLNFAETSPEELRPYTKFGPVVDYHVWPSLYLYEGGDMLKKGVAQFKDPDDETDENLMRL